MTVARRTIAIAGCGPAGLAAALLLHRGGHSVTLFERFDEPKPVGSGLMIQPTGLAVLARLGLAEAVARRGARIDALKGIEEHGRIALDAHYGKLAIPGAFGLGIHRASLFSVLYDAVRADGIEVRTGHEIADSLGNAAHRTLIFADGSHSKPFDLVVDASGWQTPLRGPPKGLLPFGALWASLPLEDGDPYARNLLEQRYRRASQMVGVLPIGRRAEKGPQEAAFFWSLKASDHAAWLATDLDDWKDDVRRLWPETDGLLERIRHREQLTFSRYAHRTAPRPSGDRYICIGDSWHSASPQLGQGANMALLDAWALMRGLDHGRTLEEGLRLATAWRQDHVALYQAVTAFFTPLYQSDAGFPALLRDRVLAPLSRHWPASRIQAMLMSGTFGWPLAQLGLDAPDYGRIASSMAARASSLDQSKSPTTRQTS